jgi:hypothetical protein
MLKDRIKELFEDYDPAIQAVISSVLSVEQEHISMAKPRVKDDIDFIIDLVANKELSRIDAEKPAERIEP